MSTASRKVAVALVSAVSLATLAACGSGSDDNSTKAAGGDTSAAAKGGVTQVKVTLTSGANGDTCGVDTKSVPAGPITFTIANQSATGVSEVELLQDQKIVGEKENLAPGLAPVSLTLTLGGGDYQIYCPGASDEMVPFTVTGKAAASPTGTAADLLQQGTVGYGKYVTTQVDAMVTAVQKLQQDIDSGDLQAAQKQYGVARPFYEKIESDVEGFVLPGYKPTDNHGNLDYLIDMRASNLDPAVGWHGFHAVERDLFQGQKITAKTKKLAAELTTNVQKLAQLSTSLTYKPEDLANGAAGLLEEVQKNKISGEEENYSHIDLVDFAANVEGAQQAFAYLKPGLTEIDSAMTDTIAQRFDAVNKMLDGYRDPAQIGGYQRYTAALKASDANKLSQTVQALQDALAHLAEKVATA
ncbi:iron uptake system protein EfeO [Nocardioides sp.]|jgi:iron uptake system component EfeO|uniref:iron uptake system protein EfeO n=1 Tax=Nocardioides sp. TaxID=35761 RepID=UPI002BD5BDDE|nr:iron uptake system protein EfeO [Nocardioides sp.]HVX53119.1 iron uptake system protein EfeO [Nocardioides sp.]